MMGPRIRLEYHVTDGRAWVDVKFDAEDDQERSIALGIVASYATARWPGTGWMQSENACRLYRVAISSAEAAHAVALDLDRPGTQVHAKLVEELERAAERLVGADQVVITKRLGGPKAPDPDRAAAGQDLRCPWVAKPTDPTNGVGGKSTTMRHV